MHIEQIQPDILLFRGEACHSVATAFLAGEALSRLRSLGCGRVIAGHMGVFAGSVLANAQTYLQPQTYLQRIGACICEIRRQYDRAAVDREIRGYASRTAWLTGWSRAASSVNGTRTIWNA